MLAWSEELITDVRKPEIIVMTSLWARRAIFSYSDHPRKLVTLNPKLKSERRTLPASFPLVGCLPRQLGLKGFMEVRTLWHCSRLKRRGALPMIDRDIRQAIDRCGNIWASPTWALVMVSSRAWALTAWLPKFKGGQNGQKIDVWAESPRLSPLWLSASSSACHGLLIITRDNAITYKASATKCQRTEAGETRQLLTLQMRQRDVAALDAKYTKS